MCYKCKDRHVGCHIDCNTYKKQLETQGKIKKVKQEEREYFGSYANGVRRVQGSVRAI